MFTVCCGRFVIMVVLFWIGWCGFRGVTDVICVFLVRVDFGWVFVACGCGVGGVYLWLDLILVWVLPCAGCC